MFLFVPKSCVNFLIHLLDLLVDGISSLLFVRKTDYGIYNIAERQKHNKYTNTQFYVETLNGENHGNKDSTIHKRV